MRRGGVVVVLAACGEVASSNAEIEERLAALEGQVAELSAQAEPLRAFAALSCTPGQTLAWDGTTWACAAAYSDAKAVAAVAATDAYVTKAGDNTLTGNLTVAGSTTTDTLDVASGTVQFGDSEMSFFRVSFERAGNTMRLSRNGVLLSELDLGDGTQNLQNSSIAYRAGTTGVDAKLMFNIEESPSLRCTLLHHDDDTPVPGLYVATDSGNTSLATTVWGNSTTATFVISRQGVSTHVINNSTRYQIACF